MKRGLKLWLATQESKRRPAWRLVTGLGIRGVGEYGAKALIKHFGNIPNIEKATFQELNQVNGIGNKTAKSIKEWMGRSISIEMLRSFERSCVCPGAWK